jgi:hypothetical protein
MPGAWVSWSGTSVLKTVEPKPKPADLTGLMVDRFSGVVRCFGVQLRVVINGNVKVTFSFIFHFHPFT